LFFKKKENIFDDGYDRYDIGYCQFAKGCNIRIRVRFYVLDKKNAFNPGSNPSNYT
jgi:hypothetical protein